MTGSQLTRRTALGATLLAGSLLASASALAGVFAQQVNFSTSGQPIWGSAPAPEFSEVLADTLLGANNVGANLVADLGLLGKYGVEATLTAGLRAGFQTTLRDFHIGEIDVDYPVNVEFDLPNKVVPGQSFTISSSFTVDPSAFFETTVDASKLDLGATGALEAELRLRACILTCFVDSTDPASALYFNEDFDLGAFDLITQTKDETIINIDIPGYGKPTIAGPGIDIDPAQDVTIDPLDAAFDIAVSEVTNISGKIQSADLSQVGDELAGNVLSGTITDVFTDITVDLDSFFSPPAPPLGLGPFTVNNVTLGADVFDADLITKLIAQQTLSFQGMPSVSLDLGALGTHVMALGDAVDINVPKSFTGDLTVTPTFFLDNELSNSSIVAAAQETKIAFGRLIANFPEFQVTPDIPPVVIPATSGFCLVPKLFGGCAVFVPGTPEITVVPGIDGISVGPFGFNDAVFEESITDSIIDTTIGGVPLSVDTCDVAGNACEFLPLLSTDGARSSGLFTDSLSLAFDSLVGQAFAIQLASAPAVPVPGTGLLLLAGVLMLGWSGGAARSA